jgi:hypothetical protein
MEHAKTTKVSKDRDDIVKNAKEIIRVLLVSYKDIALIKALFSKAMEIEIAFALKIVETFCRFLYNTYYLYKNSKLHK